VHVISGLQSERFSEAGVRFAALHRLAVPSRKLELLPRKRRQLAEENGDGSFRLSLDDHFVSFGILNSVCCCFSFDRPGSRQCQRKSRPEE
jgi:hypothetical protein